MQTLEWSNEKGARSRPAWLLLEKGGALKEFAGETIPGWVVVTSSRFVKNGKWSHTKYTLALADDVRQLPLMAGWDTLGFLEGLAAGTGKPTTTWAEVADALGVPEAEARRYMMEFRPKSAEKLNQTEVELASL